MRACLIVATLLVLIDGYLCGVLAGSVGFVAVVGLAMGGFGVLMAKRRQMVDMWKFVLGIVVAIVGTVVNDVSTLGIVLSLLLGWSCYIWAVCFEEATSPGAMERRRTRALPPRDGRPALMTIAFVFHIVTVYLLMRPDIFPLPGLARGLIAFAILVLALVFWDQGRVTQPPKTSRVPMPDVSRSRAVFMTLALLALVLGLLWFFQSGTPPAAKLVNRMAEPIALDDGDKEKEKEKSPDLGAGADLGGDTGEEGGPDDPEEVEISAPENEPAESEDPPDGGDGVVARIVGGVESLTPDQIWPYLVAAAVACLGLYFLLRFLSKKKKEEDGEEEPATELLPTVYFVNEPLPEYLEEFFNVFSHLGFNRHRGQTLREFLEWLKSERVVGDEFDPMQRYHYKQRYGETPPTDSEQESNFRRQLRDYAASAPAG